jgi:hypothetical protein
VVRPACRHRFGLMFLAHHPRNSPQVDQHSPPIGRDAPGCGAGATKSAKRRAAKQRTLAEQLAAAGAGVRVINRGANPGDLPPAARPTGGAHLARHD